MTKKIYILNGSGTAGKGELAKAISKYITTYKYSSIDLVKEMYETIGIDRNNKDEKKRKLYSDTKDMLTQYDDIPFKDIASIVADFKNNKIEEEVLLIDIREPDEIARAEKTFGAETILVRRANAKKITSNHADRDVENYVYDYIIENNGTLEQLDDTAYQFIKYTVNNIMPDCAHVIRQRGKNTLVFVTNKMLKE